MNICGGDEALDGRELEWRGCPRATTQEADGRIPVTYARVVALHQEGEAWFVQETSSSVLVVTATLPLGWQILAQDMSWELRLMKAPRSPRLGPPISAAWHIMTAREH